jgi:hypothetical protein
MRMKIPITIEDLKSVLRIDDKAAQQIIEQTEIVRIEETLIDVEKTGNIITVEAPADLGDALWLIDLIDKYGARIKTLPYDPKTEKFRQPKKS